MNREHKIVFIDQNENDDSSRLYWKNKSPWERLSAVEFLREQCYAIQGYKASPRIIRELKIVGRKAFIKNKRALGRHKDLADLELLGEKV